MINFISLMPTRHWLTLNKNCWVFLPNFFIFQAWHFCFFPASPCQVFTILVCCDVSWNVSIIVVTQRQIKKTTSSTMSESRSPGSPTSGASTALLGNCRMLTEATGATTLTSLAPALQTPDCPSLNCQRHLPRGKTHKMFRLKILILNLLPSGSPCLAPPAGSQHWRRHPVRMLAAISSPRWSHWMIWSGTMR